MTVRMNRRDVNSKNLSSSGISKKIVSVGKNLNVSDTKKVLTLYFDIIKQLILLGYEVKIPDFGRIAVVKFEQGKRTRPLNYPASRIIGKLVYVNNPIRGKHYYAVVFESHKLKKLGYNFKANYDFRKDLNKILLNNPEIDFRNAESFYQTGTN